MTSPSKIMEVRKQWNDSLSIERKKIAILKFYIQKKKRFLKIKAKIMFSDRQKLAIHL